MRAGMTAVILQPVKIVSSEIRDTWALLEPSHRKKLMAVLVSPVCLIVRLSVLFLKQLFKGV